MIIALVRHADAGKRGSQPDAERALTARGLAQAGALVKQLAALKLERILSSPYVRCRQTVEPLAAARGLRVEAAEVLAEGHGPRELMALMTELAPAGAALCSHGDVIGGLVNVLQDLRLIRRDQASLAKASSWLLDIREGEIAGARYLPPPG